MTRLQWWIMAAALMPRSGRSLIHLPVPGMRRRLRSIVPQRHFSHSPSPSDPSQEQRIVSSLERSKSTLATGPRWKKRLRQRISNIISVAGFLSSSIRSLLFAPTNSQRSFSDPLVELSQFLQTTQIDQELTSLLFNRNLLNNLLLLRIVERSIEEKNTVARDVSSTNDASTTIPSFTEALRYMKWATAVYGESMIRAAEMDVLGTVDNVLYSRVTAQRISDHCSVPVEDIVRMDIDYEGDCNHLRHLVAIDHANKAIILAIRGTFTISEILVDVAGFARPFCGGEAHSEMATMAERVWEVARPTVLDLLKKYPQYELVLVGHSLGAGVASLLNILLHHNHQALLQNDDPTVPRTTTIRCFAYACPPTFTPLDQIPEAVAACSHYIHGQDVVPFLSVDNIRHLFHRIRAIDQHPMSLRDRLQLIGSEMVPLGSSTATIPESLIQDVLRAQQNRLEVKPGAPLLLIPAVQTIWMKETTPMIDTSTSASSSKKEDEYEYRIYDSHTLAHTGIRLDTRMMSDHFPSRYEHAFHHLKAMSSSPTALGKSPSFKS